MKSKVSITLNGQAEITAQFRSKGMSDPELFAALRQAKRDWKVSKKEYNKAYDRVDEAGDKHGRPSPQWHKQSRRADKYWKRTHWADDSYLVYDAQVRSRGLY